MRIQIDTTAKTLKLDEAIKMSELMQALEMLFPKNEWKEFQLLTDVRIDWTSPIIIERPALPWTWPYQPYTQPYHPYPWITYYDTTGNNYQFNTGIFDVEIPGM